MMPLYYGSGARTVPEYLGLRFDQKTRLLNACMFTVMTIASTGIALCVMARLFQALHIFEPLFYSYGWPREGIFTNSHPVAIGFSTCTPALSVKKYL